MATKKIGVLAVDDHPLLLQGIESILEDAEDIELIGQASDGCGAVAQYIALHPDVTLMDVQMPEMNGIDALIAIRNYSPAARVIMLTVYRGDTQARRAIQAGAAGYLLKSMVQKELREAIRTVHAGGKYLPVQVAVELANGTVEQTLSASEVDVLKLVSKGFSNKRIGAALDMSEESVKSRMKGILGKLEASDRTHAAMIALRRGIIDIE